MAQLLEESFKQSRLVPDLIQHPPHKTLKALFPAGGEAAFGNELSTHEVTMAPEIYFEGEPNKLYTLIMTDNQKNMDYLHWMVVNVPGCRVNDGMEIVPYAGPTPPPKTGVHRYALLAFQQQDTIPGVAAKQKRTDFKVNKFVQDHHLGDPIAGNFFQV